MVDGGFRVWLKKTLIHSHEELMIFGSSITIQTGRKYHDPYLMDKKKIAFLDSLHEHKVVIADSTSAN